MDKPTYVPPGHTAPARKAPAVHCKKGKPIKRAPRGVRAAPLDFFKKTARISWPGFWPGPGAPDTFPSGYRDSATTSQRGDPDEDTADPQRHGPHPLRRQDLPHRPLAGAQGQHGDVPRLPHVPLPPRTAGPAPAPVRPAHAGGRHPGRCGCLYRDPCASRPYRHGRRRQRGRAAGQDGARVRAERRGCRRAPALRLRPGGSAGRGDRLCGHPPQQDARTPRHHHPLRAILRRGLPAS